MFSSRTVKIKQAFVEIARLEVSKEGVSHMEYMRYDRQFIHRLRVRLKVFKIPSQF